MSLVEFWLGISFLASRTLLVPASLMLMAYLWYRHRSRDALVVLIGFYGGTALSYLLKRIFQIPRPSDSLIPIEGYSFPSGHALSSIIFYSLLIILFRKEIKNKISQTFFISFNVLAFLLIGLSRIMLKVHYFSDVLGGYLIGALWLFMVYVVLEKINRDSN